MTALSREEIVERVASFSHWRYPFEIGDISITPTNGKRDVESLRSLQSLIWPAVLERCGGSLHGLSVLDIGCNSGYWSLEAVRSGAERVVGIDVGPVYIEQANFIRDAMDIEKERLEYREASVYDLDAKTFGRFDVVLLMRVLYHLRHPLFALERVREVCASVLVADVRLAYKAALSPDALALFLRPQEKYGPNGRYEAIQHLEPTRAAFELMLVNARFRDPTWVRPSAAGERDRHLRAYTRGKRAIVTAGTEG